MKDEIHQLLDQKVKQYNHVEFIEKDPICIPHLFTKQQDIEIAGFFAAIFAWGNRTTIINKCNELMVLMENAPYQFISQHQELELKRFLNFGSFEFNFGGDILEQKSHQLFRLFIKDSLEVLHHCWSGRVVDDATTGEVRLEVGMGRHDREAFTMIHGELPTAQAMRQVIDAVLPHRTEGADAHPFNQFGVERLSRWKAIKDPSSIGFSTLAPADPPVLRTNVKDSVPCVAIGLTGAKRLSTAVFVHGVDLDCVSFAVDAASRLGTQDVTIAVRRRDVIASIERLANMASIQVRLAYLS